MLAPTEMKNSPSSSPLKGFYVGFQLVTVFTLCQYHTGQEGAEGGRQSN